MRGDPDQEAKLWLRKLAEVDQKRGGFQDMAAEGLIAFDELRTRLAALEETRQTARRKLAALEGRRERIEQMERDRDILLEQYEGLAPDALDTLTPEERQEFYKILKLRVTVGVDGTLEATGAFFEGAVFCLSPSTQTRSCSSRCSTPTLTPTSSLGSSPARRRRDRWYPAPRASM